MKSDAREIANWRDLLRRLQRAFKRITLFFAVSVCLLAALSTFALGQPQYVADRASPGSFLIAEDSSLATLFVDTNDFPGVVRAVHDL